MLSDKIVFDVRGDSYSVEYGIWREMLRRCYSENWKSKHETYRSATCCNEWNTYSAFKDWFSNQVYYKGLQLDKDLIPRGAKVYSPDTCCFVPSKVNSVLLHWVVNRSELPIGVCFEKDSGRFGSFNSKHRLGKFDTPLEAHRAWQLDKIKQILEMVDWYSSQQCFRDDVAKTLTSVSQSIKTDYENMKITHCL